MKFVNVITNALASLQFVILHNIAYSNFRIEIRINLLLSIYKLTDSLLRFMDKLAGRSRGV